MPLALLNVSIGVAFLAVWALIGQILLRSPR